MLLIDATTGTAISCEKLYICDPPQDIENMSDSEISALALSYGVPLSAETIRAHYNEYGEHHA